MTKRPGHALTSSTQTLNTTKNYRARQLRQHPLQHHLGTSSTFPTIVRCNWLLGSLDKMPTKTAPKTGTKKRSAISDVVAREYTIHLHKRVRYTFFDLNSSFFGDDETKMVPDCQCENELGRLGHAGHSSTTAYYSYPTSTCEAGKSPS